MSDASFEVQCVKMAGTPDRYEVIGPPGRTVLRSKIPNQHLADSLCALANHIYRIGVTAGQQSVQPCVIATNPRNAIDEMNAMLGIHSDSPVCPIATNHRDAIEALKAMLGTQGDPSRWIEAQAMGRKVVHESGSCECRDCR